MEEGATNWGLLVFNLVIAIFIGLYTGDWMLALIVAICLEFSIIALPLQIIYWAIFPLPIMFLIVVMDILGIIVILNLIYWFIDYWW